MMVALSNQQLNQFPQTPDAETQREASDSEQLAAIRERYTQYHTMSYVNNGHLVEMPREHFDSDAACRDVLHLETELSAFRALYALPSDNLPNKEQYEREADIMPHAVLKQAYVAAKLLNDVKAWKVLSANALHKAEMEDDDFGGR